MTDVNSNETTTNISTNPTEFDVAENTEGVEQEKVDWVERAIEYEATPKSLREPQDKMSFIDNVCKVPRATYYYEINKRETQEKIIDICFKQAKKRTPEILEKLGKKAEDGDNQSIGMFMDYVLDKTKKSEVEHKGEVKISHEIKPEDLDNMVGIYERNKQNSISESNNG